LRLVSRITIDDDSTDSTRRNDPAEPHNEEKPSLFTHQWLDDAAIASKRTREEQL